MDGPEESQSTQTRVETREITMIGLANRIT